MFGRASIRSCEGKQLECIFSLVQAPNMILQVFLSEPKVSTLIVSDHTSISSTKIKKLIFIALFNISCNCELLKEDEKLMILSEVSRQCKSGLHVYS